MKNSRFQLACMVFLSPSPSPSLCLSHTPHKSKLVTHTLYKTKLQNWTYTDLTMKHLSNQTKAPARDMHFSFPFKNKGLKADKSQLTISWHPNSYYCGMYYHELLLYLKANDSHVSIFSSDPAWVSFQVSLWWLS